MIDCFSHWNGLETKKNTATSQECENFGLNMETLNSLAQMRHLWWGWGWGRDRGWRKCYNSLNQKRRLGWGGGGRSQCIILVDSRTLIFAHLCLTPGWKHRGRHLALISAASLKRLWSKCWPASATEPEMSRRFWDSYNVSLVSLDGLHEASRAASWNFHQRRYLVGSSIRQGLLEPWKLVLHRQPEKSQTRFRFRGMTVNIFEIHELQINSYGHRPVVLSAMRNGCER